jgi:hypothetical protein
MEIREVVCENEQFRHTGTTPKGLRTYVIGKEED